METPNDLEGQITEEVMREIVGGWPGRPHSAEKYNRCYEAVYALLREMGEMEARATSAK